MTQNFSACDTGVLVNILMKPDRTFWKKLSEVLLRIIIDNVIDTCMPAVKLEFFSDYLY